MKFLAVLFLAPLLLSQAALAQAPSDLTVYGLRLDTGTTASPKTATG